MQKKTKKKNPLRKAVQCHLVPSGSDKTASAATLAAARPAVASCVSSLSSSSVDLKGQL